MRDQPLAVYGRGDDKGGGMALEMTLWSRDTILCTDGPADLSDACRKRLDRNGILVREERIVRLEIASSVPYQASFNIIFESGPRPQRAALFFNAGRHQSTDLAKRLGCDTYESRAARWTTSSR